MTRRAIALTAFVPAVAAYLYCVFMLTIAPASILYSKPPVPQGTFATYLLEMWQHELAVAVTGGSILAYAISLFRKCPDWRPFGVLLLGLVLAFAVFQLFGL